MEKIQHKFYSFEDVKINKSEKEDKRIFKGIMSSSDIDLMDEVLLPSGLDKKGFIGTIFFNHNRDMPIGESLDIRKNGDRLVATGRIATEGISQKIDEIWDLIKDGIIKGISVGFRIIEQRQPTKEDIKTFGKKVRNVISKWKLLEYSVVTSPCNQSALITACKSLSLDPKELLGKDYTEEEIEEIEEKPITEQLELEIDDLDINIDITEETKEKIVEVVKKTPTVNLKQVITYFKDELSKQIRKSRGNLY